jgi:ABC-type dipeptide/oligopeptide/nickel transport system permease component
VIKIARWLLSTAAIIWLAASIAFVGLRVIPGDALEAQLLQSGADENTVAARRAALGLNQPVLIQYTCYLSNLLQGDLGYSFISGQPVTDMILQQLAPTLSLAIPAWVLSGIAGVTLGILGGTKPQSGWGRIAPFITDLALSTPIYWSGTLLIYASNALLNSTAVSVSSWLLPTLLLGFHTSGSISRIVQTNADLIHRSDFVRTARAKGLSNSLILRRHILRIAILPAIPALGLQFGFLLGGAVITESLFARPGLGRLLLNSTLQQDYPVVQGLVILSAGTYALLHGATSLISELLDPRIRV